MQVSIIYKFCIDCTCIMCVSYFSCGSVHCSDSLNLWTIIIQLANFSYIQPSIPQHIMGSQTHEDLYLELTTHVSNRMLHAWDAFCWIINNKSYGDCDELYNTWTVALDFVF